MKKLIFLSLAALAAFSSCKKDKDDEPRERIVTVTGIDMSEVEGTPTTVKAVCYLDDMVVLAQAPMSGNGFTITLPATLDNGKLEPLSELFSDPDAPDAMVNYVYLEGYSQDDDYVCDFSEYQYNEPSEWSATFFYSNKAFTYQGISVAAGWNILYEGYDGESHTATTTRPAGQFHWVALVY